VRYRLRSLPENLYPLLLEMKQTHGSNPLFGPEDGGSHVWDKVWNNEALYSKEFKEFKGPTDTRTVKEFINAERSNRQRTAITQGLPNLRYPKRRIRPQDDYVTLDANGK
jgi:hypothetical protein